MRGLVLFILLSLSFTPQAGVTHDEIKVCQMQARISAKASQNAQTGMTLKTQLLAWDKYTKTDKAKHQSKSELGALRILIESAWELYTELPDVKPNQVGDYVYSTCINEKENHPVVKF